MTDLLFEKVIPQSMEAEQSVIGAMLLESDAVRIALTVLREQDFYRETHRMIYAGIRDLHGKKEPADLITLGEWLKARDELEAIGGTHYLASLMHQVPTAAGIKQYCEIVQQKSLQRQMIKLADTMMHRAYVSDKPNDLILTLQRELGTLQQEHAPAAALRTLGQWAEEALRDMDHEVEQGVPSGIMTGLHEFDKHTGGFKRGEVTIIGALSSVGKSHFVLNNVSVPAAKAGNTVLILSSEMRPKPIAMRATIAEATQTRNSHIKTSTVRNANWRQAYAHVLGIEIPIAVDLDESVTRMWEWPVFVEQPKTLTPNTILRYGYECRQKHGLNMICIDYLQRMRGDGKYNDLRLETIDISHRLHEIAEELNVPVVVVSALNRAGANRAKTSMEPIKSDLAESSALEYDTDLLVFLHRPYSYDKDCDPHDAVLIIDKNRNGSVGRMALFFDDEKNCFREVYHD